MESFSHPTETDRSTFVARLTDGEISKAVLPNTFIFPFATKTDFLQRIRSSSPWGIFFGVSFIADARAGNPLCISDLLCCRASSCEEHSSFILSCNLIGQGENKSHYVTEIVFWLGFVDVIFGGTKWQPEIRLRSQPIIVKNELKAKTSQDCVKIVNELSYEVVAKDSNHMKHFVGLTTLSSRFCLTFWMTSVLWTA